MGSQAQFGWDFHRLDEITDQPGETISSEEEARAMVARYQRWARYLAHSCPPEGRCPVCESVRDLLPRR